MPHYSVKVHVSRDMTLIYVTIFSFLGLLGYVGLRIYYLVPGTVELASNTSVPYSWLVLAAEVAIAMLGFYCRMLTKRQDPDFRGMGRRELEALVQVR